MRIEELLAKTQLTQEAALAEWAVDTSKKESRASLTRERVVSQKALQSFGYTVLSTFNTLQPDISRAIILSRPDKDLGRSNFKVARFVSQAGEDDHAGNSVTDLVVQVFDAAEVSSELLEEGLALPTGAEVVGPAVACTTRHHDHAEFIGFKQATEVWKGDLHSEGSDLNKGAITRDALNGYFMPRAETVGMLVRALDTRELNELTGLGGLPDNLQVNPLLEYLPGV